MDSRRSVILLKAEEADRIKKSKYEELLTSNNYIVLTVNTLLFDYVNLKNLHCSLVTPEDYSGMFFASPRCVNAVKIALDNHGEELHPKWREYNNYVVGNQTYDIALEKLSLECKGKDTGNANTLADLILEGAPLAKPLLVPHGSLKTNILKEKLSAHTELHEIEVYETKENANIAVDFQQAINSAGLPNYIVFFSPSGVNAAFDVLTQQSDYKQIKLIAIGPTTALAMQEKGLSLFKTLVKPTPENLISAL